MTDLPRLNECQRLEEFIHGAKATRKNDKRLGIFDKHRFAHTEVTEVN